MLYKNNILSLRKLVLDLRQICLLADYSCGWNANCTHLIPLKRCASTWDSLWLNKWKHGITGRKISSISKFISLFPSFDKHAFFQLSCKQCKYTQTLVHSFSKILIGLNCFCTGRDTVHIYILHLFCNETAHHQRETSQFSCPKSVEVLKSFGC